VSRGKSRKNITAEVGERIRRIRGQQTQQEFAEGIGVLQGTLSKYERGTTPDPEVLRRIARAGGTSVEWLLTGQEMVPPGLGPADPISGLLLSLPAQKQAPLAALSEREPSPGPSRQRRLPGMEEPAAAENAWADFLASLLRCVPGAPAVLSRHLAAALRELADTPWSRLSKSLADGSIAEQAPSPAARIYAQAAPAWCEHWSRAESLPAAFFAQAFPAGQRILEVGPGCGRDLARLLELGYDAWGVEAVEAVRREAERRHPTLAGRLKPGAVPGLAGLFKGAFDGVLCVNVLQEIPRSSLLPAALELCALLRPGGRLLLSVPQLDDPGEPGAGAIPVQRIPPDGLQFLLECLGGSLLDRRETPGLPGHSVTLLFEIRAGDCERRPQRCSSLGSRP